MRFKTIGIICAMDEEMEQVVLHLDHVHTVLEQAGLKFVEGTASGLKVYVVRCGIGKVNSALCSQIMIDKLDPDAVLDIGVAGALDDALEQGDILISQNAQQHDFDTSQLGDPKGIISRMDTSIFPADPDLIRAASLKKTSLYDLAGLCGIEDAKEFTARFIECDRKARRGV